MFFEGIDNDHGRAAGLAGVRACRWIIVNDVCFWRNGNDGVVGEEFTQSLQLLNTNVVGEESVVTVAMDA